jgi:DNA replication protein DnaC
MSEPERIARLAELAAQRYEEGVVTEPEAMAELVDLGLISRDVATRQLAERRWAAQITARFAAASIVELDDDLRGRLSRWANTPPRPSSLVLTGPVGTGKTYAACAAVRPLVEQGATLAFWPVVRLLDQLRPGRDDDPYPAAVAADLLVLDDLGAERATDWTAERLYALVNDRWLAERPTIVTTNLAPPQLTAAVGERLASRLLGGATTALLSGPDRRMR